MKILIVGGDSMVGKRLRMRLMPNHAVTTAGRSKNVDHFFDLSGESDLAWAGRYDVIVHCAANFAGNSIDDMLRNEEVNGVGALRVCRLAQRCECRHVVYLSTIFSCDVPENGYYGSYGLSKRHGQENIEYFCRRSGVAFTALLPSQLYDDREEARKHQPFFYRILDCAAADQTVILHGQADPLRNFLYVEDLTRIIELSIERRVEGVYPCVHPQSHRLSEIAALAFSVYGHTGRVEFLADKPDIPTVFIPEGDSLYRALGYTPETSLLTGMGKIRLHQENRG